ncbi:hydroxyacid dehydrogenase [Pollutimonas nitritireducens]|uniref:Hydroxyacid dehydrogenase n=1 Tax=Pollutimonas nitritireducens TaxID=2045209 RepID=A0A2N4UHZ4_9BURK|nr:D-2-hydroxyacid dehydrogenase family protein [Pollutimonas nitritireducens]PLC54642.1 hydroxyacid dehydrogenase [Pollutimonas nitritireducens]
MNICVLDDYQAVASQCANWDQLGNADTVHFFNEPIPQTNLVERLKQYDVIVAMRERTRFPAALLRQLTNLRLLVTTGPRNKAIDLAACRELGIVVCGTRSDPLLAAEHAWAMIMALFKRVAPNDADLRRGLWQPALNFSMKGCVLGLIGLGKLGQRMAHFGRAFDMEVIAWSPNLTAERCAPFNVHYVGKQELLSRADVVSVHMVLGESTRNILAAQDLRFMKNSAYLVNTSRGGLVDEAALCEALKEGRLAGAALDVFDVEPLPADSSVLRAPNMLLSPHVGYGSWQNYRVYYGDAVENIKQWRAGNPIRLLEG